MTSPMNEFPETRIARRFPPGRQQRIRSVALGVYPIARQRDLREDLRAAEVNIISITAGHTGISVLPSTLPLVIEVQIGDSEVAVHTRYLVLYRIGNSDHSSTRSTGRQEGAGLRRGHGLRRDPRKVDSDKVDKFSGWTAVSGRGLIYGAQSTDTQPHAGLSRVSRSNRDAGS
jgi:hypothetical protein